MIDITIDNIHKYDFIFADDINPVDKEDLEDAIVDLERNDFPYEGRQLFLTITRLEELLNEAITDGDLEAVIK